ncbi:MAG: hypothetical protein KDC67_03915, partial [Ignavibacteriae bacterium]|nr:hypothetical protein [Ignavibacteriota bacterium]
EISFEIVSKHIGENDDFNSFKDYLINKWLPASYDYHLKLNYENLMNYRDLIKTRNVKFSNELKRIVLSEESTKTIELFKQTVLNGKSNLKHYTVSKFEKILVNSNSSEKIVLLEKFISDVMSVFIFEDKKIIIPLSFSNR